MREIDMLAHSLALELAVGSVQALGAARLEDGVRWLEVSPEELSVFAGELQYLEMRGAIERHPSRRDWLRIVKAGAVE